MENIDGVVFHFAYCERYNAIAQDFYEQFINAQAALNACSCPMDLFEANEETYRYYALFDAKENAALCAIIFEALSIEAYVNFWGASLLGDDIFYSKYEFERKSTEGSSKKRRSLNTLDKIKKICKEEYHTPYPTDGVHYCALKKLFQNRDRLVHYKPKQYCISRPSPKQLYTPEMYNDYLDACKELDFIFDGIDDQMRLYQEVKDNLAKCSGKTDPFYQQLEDTGKEIGKAIVDMLNLC